MALKQAHPKPWKKASAFVRKKSGAIVVGWVRRWDRHSLDIMSDSGVVDMPWGSIADVHFS